jgi:GNAT superfamily N-acetyltransferase
MIQLVRIFDDLPEGFDALRAEAAAEGHGNMDRLAVDWASGAQRFDREGEALLAAFVDGELAGIGGITVEPTATEAAALRMRRLYVARPHRRGGVARTIASALAQEAFGSAAWITVHAGNPGAEAFWEAQGFIRVRGRPWSHELRREGAAQATPSSA